MRLLPPRFSDERGVAMMLVIGALAFLGALGTTLIVLVTDETTRSSASVSSQTSFQAAEAGIDDYLAKLVDNRLYYLQWVHPAESTRRDSGFPYTVVGVSASCTAGSKPKAAEWKGTDEWTPPNGKDRWCQLAPSLTGETYEYNLQITAPKTDSNATEAIHILATGRRVGSDRNERAIEVLVDMSSVADYQMLSASTVRYGDDATTTGKIYSAVDISHEGIAKANLYAERNITYMPTLQPDDEGNMPVAYNSTNIPTPPKGTNVAALHVALIDVRRAAEAGGVDLNDFDSGSYHGWRVTFQADGKFLFESCKKNGSADLAAQTPQCGGAGNYTSPPRDIPSNGAIYATKTIIVSGPGSSGINGPSTVNGRVTLASNDDIVIAGNIRYVEDVDCECGDDVLGLVALNSVYVADWAPNQLSWRAASLAQTYQWRAWTCDRRTLPRSNATPQSTMTYYGSTITNGVTSNPDRPVDVPYTGGCMASYDKRFYNYDKTLLYLPPPWFPTIDVPYKVLLFREVSPGL